MGDTEVATTEKKEVETSTTTASPEETSKESTKETNEVKKDEVITPEEKEELFDEIEPLENDERGKFSLKVGDSTYYGKTKKEVIQNLIKGKEEQDTYIRKVKASEKVKLPDEYKGGKKEDTEPVVEMPDETELYQKHLATLVRQSQLDPKMFSWKREQWNEYKETNQLADWEIGRLVDRVERTVQKANELTDKDMATANVAFINNGILNEETDSVREMLVESGIDQDKFDYEAVLEVATKKVGKNGIIQSGAITAEAGKQIAKILKQSTPIKKDLSKEIEKGKEAKDKIKTPPGSGKKAEDDDEKPATSWDALARELKKKAGVGN